MPKIGPYETGQRHHLSGVGGLYTIVSSERTIKVLQPPVGIWPGSRIQEEVDAFRLRAKIQKSLAAKSTRWAPVHDVAAIRSRMKGAENGEAAADVDALSTLEEAFVPPPAGGAYCVMDRYERSLQTLIDGRVHVQNADLRHIITEVIHGLLDIRKTGRAHGNLKASNILLKNSTDLTTATVHLADPAPDGSLTKAADEKDLRDLALIIYELVYQRPYDGGTVPRTKEWNALGPHGEDWREFVNVLLDRQAPAEERDLEKKLPVIATWLKKPKQSKAPMLAAASLSFLMIGGLVFYFVLRPIIWPPVQWDQERWNVLNLEYRAWFEDFSNEMYVKASRERIKKPPFPSEIGQLLDDAGDLSEIDPAVIAQNKGIPWDRRLLEPTQRAMNPGAGPEATKRGVELIQGIQSVIATEKWALLDRMSDTATQYEQRGWEKYAARIRQIVEQAKPPVAPPATMPMPDRIKIANEIRETRKETVYANLVQTVDAFNQINALNLSYLDIQNRMPTLIAGDAANVKLLANFKAFADRLPKEDTTGDLATLAQTFKTIQDLMEKIAQASAGTPAIDFAALAEDPAAQAEPSLEAYAALTAILPEYRRLATDPRTVPAWNTRLSSIKGEMIDLIAKEVAPEEPRFAAIREQYASTTEAIKKSGEIRPIAKFKEQIDTSVASINASLNTLYDAANSHPAYMNEEKFAAFVSLQRSRYMDARQMPPAIAAAAKPIRDKWLAAQTALTRTVAARSLDQFRQTHVRDKAQFQYLDDFYADANQTLPDNDAHRTALLGAFASNSPWQPLAVHVANEYRENLLSEFLLKAVSKADAPPALDNAEYKSQRATFLAEYQRICQEALALFTDQGTITTRLDQLYLQANEPAADSATFRDLFAKWRDSKSTLLADPAIAAVIKPITERVTALLAVDELREYAPLVASVQSPAPEVALASWRKLASIPLTEELPALEDELKSQAALTAHFTNLTQAQKLPAARVQALNAELAAQRPVRWRRWVNTLTAPEKIRVALDNVKAFDVSLTPQADSPMLYYQALFALQSEFDKSQREADLKAPAQLFIDTISTLPETVSKNPDVVELVNRMTKSLTAKEEETSAGAGPQLADWEVDKSKESEGIRTFRSKDRKFTIDFVKMQVVQGNSQKTVFLATTEMSLGLFIETMNSSGRLDDIDNDKKTGSANQHWFKIQAAAGNDVYLANGPRGWRLVQGRFTINGDWLDDAGPLMTDKPYYPANGAPTPPRLNHPAQLISPWSAMFAARLLGSRLPTSDEWKMAYQTYETPAGRNLPKDLWNLRGENPKGPSWGSQQAHASVMAANGLKYPDQGMFLPRQLIFSNITGKDAKPWTGDALAKIAPERVTATPSPYQNSNLWFLEVDKQNPPQPQPPLMHHLVGNVAEYVFDGEYGPATGAGSTVAAVVKDNKPTAAAIDAFVSDRRNADKLAVIGGSSLSAPNIVFNERSPLNMQSPQTSIGFADVGFRLAFTAPIDSISDVLASVFRGGKPVPGPRVSRN